MTHSHDADALRDHYLRHDGQAPTVQGELMRSVDTLREDAAATDHPWSGDHDIMRDFIGDILLGAGVFQLSEQDEIREDLAALSAPDPAPTVEPYARLTRRIVQWTELHPEPVPHHPNAELQR